MAPRAPVDAFTKAVELLAGQERSAWQVRAALARRGHSESDIDAALERAKSLGYLDDRRVIEARVRKGLAEGKSRLDVARRLEAQGLDSTLVKTAIDAQAASTGQSDELAAKALLARRGLSGVKAARLLASRGFDPDLIEKLVGIDSSTEGL